MKTKWNCHASKNLGVITNVKHTRRNITVAIFREIFCQTRIIHRHPRLLPIQLLSTAYDDRNKREKCAVILTCRPSCLTHLNPKPVMDYTFNGLYFADFGVDSSSHFCFKAQKLLQVQLL